MYVLYKTAKQFVLKYLKVLFITRSFPIALFAAATHCLLVLQSSEIITPRPRIGTSCYWRSSIVAYETFTLLRCMMLLSLYYDSLTIHVISIYSVKAYQGLFPVIGNSPLDV